MTMNVRLKPLECCILNNIATECELLESTDGTRYYVGVAMQFKAANVAPSYCVVAPM